MDITSNPFDLTGYIPGPQPLMNAAQFTFGGFAGAGHADEPALAQVGSNGTTQMSAQAVRAPVLPSAPVKVASPAHLPRMSLAEELAYVLQKGHSREELKEIVYEIAGRGMENGDFELARYVLPADCM